MKLPSPWEPLPIRTMGTRAVPDRAASTGAARGDDAGSFLVGGAARSPHSCGSMRKAGYPPMGVSRCVTEPLPKGQWASLETGWEGAVSTPTIHVTP